ncbi:molybdopterin cofactor-binding domain-containing protein [Microtetraspora malaysiensis]|uniref:molybdopterin cofactor-binding domain-containing protein n=1 Tax=Microtetraspora malaysiensis TaxID=161358 RepID=UPI003D944C2C
MGISRHARHPEWDARTSGAAAYTADFEMEGMLHGALVRSPHPHARIVSIDPSAALRMPGVRVVLTAADLPDRLYQDYGVTDRPALAVGRVRHVGEEVALVIAESEESARAGAAKVKVRYRRLRTVDSAEDARSGRAVPLHAGQAGNVAKEVTREYGDIAAARSRSTTTRRARYRYPNQAHACMEPSVALAWYDRDSGVLNLQTPTQAARNIQREVAHMLDLDLEKVRIQRAAVGGDFGSRVRASDIEVLAAAGAIRTNRPVRIRLNRAEEFAYTKHRFDFEIDLVSGVDDDGALTFREADVVVDCGAYTHAGGNELTQATGLLTAQYDLGGAAARGQAVYTNRRPGGSFRGAGLPQAVFALESQMDELAEALGVDPAEFRSRNFNRPGSPTLNGWEPDTLALDECLRAVQAELDWDEARSKGGRGRGVGIAAAIHVTGAVVSEASSRAGAVVSVDGEGAVTVRTGSSDPGTGQYLVAAQVVAEELGVPTATVRVEAMDTATTPYDPGAGASRGTYTTGRAVHRAASELGRKLRETAAAKFGVSADEVVLDAGLARVGQEEVSLGDLVGLCPDQVDGELSVSAESTAEIPILKNPLGKGNLAPSYACAVHGVEVDVDLDTGKVTVLRVVAAHDSGTIVNPRQAEGQVVGGVVMALGATLGEELILEGGRVVNSGYQDYALPRAADAPPVKVVFVGAPDRHGPYGAKGLAEVALSPTAPAVANAIAHAVGLRMRHLPITPDKIVDAAVSERLRPGHRHVPVWRRPGRWWIAAFRWLYPRGMHFLLHRFGTSMARRPDPVEVQALERPRDAAAAVALASRSPRPAFIGGGTDLLVARQQGLAGPATLIDVTLCKELTGIVTEADGSLRIGAAVTLSDLEAACDASGLPGDRMLAQALRSIASRQIRNVATVAGNLCQQKRCWFYRNGFDCYKRSGPTAPCYAVSGDHRFYHAVLDGHRCQATTPSDLATAFAALDATVTIQSPTGSREIPVARFYRGPGETALADDELVLHVTVPRLFRESPADFRKLGLWSGDFAVVSVATSLQFDTENGVVSDVRIAMGGVAPTPYRPHPVEDALRGRSIDPAALQHVVALWEREAHPLERNAWKAGVATALAVRSLQECHGGR